MATTSVGDLGAQPLSMMKLMPFLATELLRSLWLFLTPEQLEMQQLETHRLRIHLKTHLKSQVSERLLTLCTL